MRHYFDNQFKLTDAEKSAYAKSKLTKRYEAMLDEANELKQLYLACKKAVSLNGETEKANTASANYLRAEAIRVYNESQDLLKKLNTL